MDPSGDVYKGLLPIAADTDDSNQGMFDGTRFSDSLDGDDFTISNLTIYRPDEDFTGIFGDVSGDNAEITDLHLTTISVTGRRFVGGLAGWVTDVTITGNSTGGTVTGTAGHIGGLLGLNASGTISYNYSTASGVSIGGFIGQAGLSSHTGTINYNYSTGDVSTDDLYAGGFAGTLYSNSSNNFSTGSVVSTSFMEKHRTMGC